MKAHPKLTKAERDFFALIDGAVRANPFSQQRDDIDDKIAGHFPEMDSHHLIDGIVDGVASRIKRLKPRTGDYITPYRGKDRQLLLSAHLFVFFHRFVDHFDRHIEQQIQAGNTPLKVLFTKEALRYLAHRGFTDAESKHYFELSFQVRRAYYFIAQNLAGCCASMIELRRKLWNNVFTHNIDLYNRYLWNRMEDFSTLLLGETGTGKGTAASAIGRSGYIPFDVDKQRFVESFTSAFQSINLSQFSTALIESELFGHRKGSFTGAVDDYEGVLDRCSVHGAILLDEIGEVSEPIQIKLLKVLQERTFTPVGSHTEHRFKGRVIAATNRSLKELRDPVKMRQDFYYRLCSDIISISPLRQRIREDSRELTILLDLTVQRITGVKSPELVKMVFQVIDQDLEPDYQWPGNVRELEQCVRGILLNRHYTPHAIETIDGSRSKLTEGLKQGTLDAKGIISGYCYVLYKKWGTYEAVARQTNLDRRTVKKHIQHWSRNYIKQ
jgi:hypothetical protein